MAPTTKTPVRVTIDIRETDLWTALEAWQDPSGAAATEDGWYVVHKPLDVGDISFVLEKAATEDVEAVCLERKTAEDLGASQRDGRYREQRARLLAKQGAGIRIGYLLECPMPWSPTLSRTWCRGVFSEVHLQQAIIRLQLRYGISVFQTSGIRETVTWIRRIAGALVADPTVFTTGLATSKDAAAAAYTEAIHVKKATNMDADRVLVTLLRTLPGVGAAAAEAIQRHVGDAGFPGLFALDDAAIAAIPMGADGKRKVGKALAAKIWRVFHATAVVATTEATEPKNPTPD